MSHPSSPDQGVERRWWPRALLVLGAVLVAVTFGISTASVESSLGPHEARYDVTTDDTVTVDLGGPPAHVDDADTGETRGVQTQGRRLLALAEEVGRALGQPDPLRTGDGGEAVEQPSLTRRA